MSSLLYCLITYCFLCFNYVLFVILLLFFSLSLAGFLHYFAYVWYILFEPRIYWKQPLYVHKVRVRLWEHTTLPKPHMRDYTRFLVVVLKFKEFLTLECQQNTYIHRIKTKKDKPVTFSDFSGNPQNKSSIRTLLHTWKEQNIKPVTSFPTLHIYLYKNNNNNIHSVVSGWPRIQKFLVHRRFKHIYWCIKSLRFCLNIKVPNYLPDLLSAFLNPYTNFYTFFV